MVAYPTCSAKTEKTGYSGRCKILPDILVQQTQTLDYRQQGKGRDFRVLYFCQQANATFEHLPVCIVMDNIPLLDSQEQQSDATTRSHPSLTPLGIGSSPYTFRCSTLYF
jgi:hypothetical protein